MTGSVLGVKTWHKSWHNQLIFKAGSSCLSSGDSHMTVFPSNQGTVDVFGIMGLSKNTHIHTRITRRPTECWIVVISYGWLCACVLDCRGEKTVCSVPTDWSTGQLINNRINLKIELGAVEVNDWSCHGSQSNSDAGWNRYNSFKSSTCTQLPTFQSRLDVWMWPSGRQTGRLRGKENAVK